MSEPVTIAHETPSSVEIHRDAKGEKYDYVVKRPCGCIAAAVADLADDQKFTAAAVNKWIREGRTVERISLTIARTLPWECAICQHRGLS